MEPKDYHQKLSEPNTVVIDVRNTYESDIGRFGKQEGVGGATLIVPAMRKSTDFPAWITKEETKQMLQGKNVLMYCTGGVRCERASALLKKEYGESVQGVFQLQGGIEKYLMQFPDGGFWHGKNYVFDKREAFSVDNREGVGGVLKTGSTTHTQDAASAPEKKKKKRKRTDEEAPPTEDILGVCAVCAVPWDRYIGKKKCAMCGVPVLMCEKCCTKKADKPLPTSSAAAASTCPSSVLRCPLCVAENCTVPVTDIEFTANGVVAKPAKNHVAGESGNVVAGGVAARTVCKWGGGHAASKKKARQQERGDRKAANGMHIARPCKFGRACTRADCWFTHE